MRKDIDKLECVQRRATRLISEISQFSYEERLQQCRLTTLETRRLRGDQIEVFKIMQEYERLNKEKTIPTLLSTPLLVNCDHADREEFVPLLSTLIVLTNSGAWIGVADRFNSLINDRIKNMFFRIKNGSRTRGHSLALVKCQSRLDIIKYTFSQRVVNAWNKLPEECINATSVNMFKNRIDQYF